MSNGKRCGKCRRSVFTVPLHRINKTGIAGKFWCEDCIRANGKADVLDTRKPEDKEVVDDLKKIFYG